MNITTTIDGAQATVAPVGWLDTTTAPELAQTIEDLPAEVTELTLDLAGLEYISSAGLRQLVAAHRHMNGKLTLANVPAEIMQVLHMAGFDKRLRIA